MKRSILSTLVRVLFIIALTLSTTSVLAQTASDGCSYGAGSQYTVGTSCNFQDFDKPGSFGNTIIPTTCSGGNYDDAFGWFTATATSTTITYDPDNNHDALMHLYTGACGSLTYLACANAGGNGTNETITYATTIGTNYLVRIQRNANNNAMDGRLCVYSIPPPPANDDPCGAVSLTVGLLCSYTAGTNVSATSSGGVPAPTCANYTGGDVWFSFVAPASGNIQLDMTANGLTDSGMELYSATACGGTFTSIECDDDDGTNFMSYINRTGLTAGQTYYVRVWGYGGDAGTFNICAFSPIPPTNDNPCGAVALTLGSSCTFTTYNSDGATATSGISIPGCSTYSGGDVWFSFVAPASGAVTIRTGAQSITNLAMALYTATACNGTFNLVECDDNDGAGNMPFLTFSSVDLVVGQTYYLRVWQSGSSAGGTFDLCANTDPGSGDCLYILRMFDLGGDGWDGSTVTVQVGAGAPANYTLATGNQDVAYISVPTGQLVQISYTAVGGFQNEINYFVQLGSGILFQDGPTPSTGLRFASYATCTPLASPPSDCQGGTTICNSQGFNANPSHTGVRADLTVNNRGCLSADERQGTWYNFSPSNSGTVELTIAPTNAGDDYDFAIWGPMVSLACPPVGAPYRCSYSGLSGNTGLQLGAGDDTEGAGGDKWVNAMTVTTGEVYVLYISNYSRSGLAFNLTWNLTGGSSLDCTLLPVELSAFDAQPREKDVLLNWITGSEMNSSHFNVQRSTDGLAFASIGVVTAQGSTSTISHYEFVDPQPASGVNYYRLEQVDLDGTSKLSEVEAVVFRRTLSTGSPYPNPTMDQIYLDLVVGSDPDVLITTLDASGRMVRTERVRFAAGEQRYQSSVAGLDAGWYELLLTLSDGEVLHTGRFMVQ